MINKIYEKVLTFIKESYKEIIFLFLLLGVINFPLNYTIMTSGGIIDINDRVEIDNSYNSKGNFNLAYVTELKGTIPTVLLSYVIPDWTKVAIGDYQANSKETQEDILTRAKVYLEYSKQAAIKVAYNKANKQFNENSFKFYVVYIDEDINDLKIGDILLEADGVQITQMSDYKEIVDNHKVGDKIKLLILRNDKQLEVEVKVKNVDNRNLTGISVLQLYNYTTSPKVNLVFKNNESGSSGGLMLSLAIYDKLISEDLTKGLKIVGTGTIDFDGNVGEIDGVKYKLMGAVRKKADIFIAPAGDNYNECVKLKKEKRYDIDIISAETFDGVVEELANYKK